MSLREEPPQKEPEMCLHEDNLPDILDQEDQTDKDVIVITNQKEKTNLLSLLKKDLLKVFENKDVKEEHEDDPSNQTENKTTDSSTFSLLKKDQSPFKEDLPQDKDVMSVDPEVSQTTDKSTNLLSLLKEDLFKVFRGKALKKEHEDGPSNQTENKTIDSSTFSLLKEDLSHSEEDLPQDKDVKKEHEVDPSNQTDNKGAVSGTHSLLREDLTSQDKEVKSVDPKPSQTAEKSMNRLSLLKEDLFKMFRGKALKKEHEDGPSNQTENKTIDSSTFSLLKGDLSHSEEDLPQDKDVKSVDPKPSQTTDKAMNPLSLIKEDLSKGFKDKDVKEEHEDDPSNQTDNKTTDSSIFSLLEEDESPFKEDLPHDKDVKKEHEVDPSNQTDNKGAVSGTLSLLREDLTSQDKEVKSVDPKPSQTAEKSMNRLSLLKEDLFKMFRGKALKKEHEDGPSNQTENKTIDSSTFSLLKGDLSHSEEDLPQDKDVKSVDPKPSQTTDKAMNPLSLIKEDLFKGFKDKDVKEEHEDDPSNQTDNKTIDSSTFSLLEEDQSPFKDNLNINSSQDRDVRKEHKDGPLNQVENSGTCSTLSLLKEDLSPFKEDLPQDKDVMSVEPEVSQITDKSTNLLSLLKEDLFKVFKDRDVKKEHEDGQLDQTENEGTASGTLSLLKEDLSQSEDDFCQDKDVMSVDPKPSQTTDKSTNRQSLLKEDFSVFKDDLSKVFSIILSKEKDNKEDSSKIKNLKTARPDELFKNLFRRDNPLSQSQSVEDSQEVKETLPGKKEEQLDSGLRGTLSEQNEEKLNSGKKNSNVKDRVSQTEDGERDVNVSGTTTSFSETQQSEEETPAAQTAEQGAEGGLWSDGHSSVASAGDEMIKEETEDKPENLPWETLFSGIDLLGLTNANKDHMRCQPGGDLWSPKNFATYLTFDPNTANSELHLTDSNRKATRVWSDHRSSEHPDRFERCPQVLCREGLLDAVYWEVEWSGGADIGVTYNSISRDGDMESCLLGHYEWSWSLECSEGIYTPCCNNKRFMSSSPEPFTHRVGVYLDWTAGSLSFYCVSQDTVVHLHTFTSTFTEPLYPGFWVWAYDGSVSLCQVVLDWELLLL
ncbi:uncharacterized protein LOC113139681 isoform X2 [Mastacembelus armatus]|uniref:uncharacterized protein LOC113139681 isoform X2 n=1 Tax=Mastacembelus armatus TaxID=205130 RepID=UPI000E45E86B|nr:uncharacterized protein LOC113139681 isoform X2 [Mastacembelus armatus]